MDCNVYLDLMKDRAKIKELKNRNDEVLYYIWDPIGVSDEPCARIEYTAYVDWFKIQLLHLLMSKFTNSVFSQE